MLTISKPISAGQAQTYHKEEFANAAENYYTQKETIPGQWRGQLAEQWGLKGDVNQEHFARLSEGQNPLTGEQLVRHQTPREYLDERGEKVRTMEHRAGWDGVFSAPKSVSLTALVGGDVRVIEAHRQSVNVALDEMEKYVQARMGGNNPAVTTGKWITAQFEHDSSRPVSGHVAPQLHTHVVFFNLTEMENGDTRALQPQELFRTQQYATAVYRSELALRLQALGYEIVQGASAQPEIKGYSQEYIEASSPRSREIREHMQEAGVRGAGAAQIAAHQTRGAKLELSHEAVQQRHQEMAAEYGHQPQRVIQEAQGREIGHANEKQKLKVIESALTYASERNIEREAVASERELMRDALKRSMGTASLEEVRSRFEERVRTGGLIEIGQQSVGRAFTTEEMIGYERANIEWMRAGQMRHEPLVASGTRQEVEHKHAHLNQTQRGAVEQILGNRDQITALEGIAGAGKTTSLAAIREAAESEGYQVRGFAPTSRAAQKLEESGVKSTTLQRHLVKPEELNPSARHLYIIDESSLASTKQVNGFLKGLGQHDRVVMVGDVRQHQAVDAGTPYQQMQESGMQTARLDEIVRQKDPALKQVVEQLSRGDVRQAIQSLSDQGRVHEIADRQERLKEIAHEYAVKPEGTLVVSPDNESRQQINLLVHREMQQRGNVSAQEQELKVLHPNQEMTAADRAWAGNYEQGQVVRYSKGSKALGLEPGEYARVSAADRERNLITVERANGAQVSYDPRRLQGVTLYREIERTFGEGERVQFTAPSKELAVANRELGMLEKIDANGSVRIKMDSGHSVAFNVRQHPHLDYGYAMTSYSSQAQTADRVLVHVESERSAGLVNNRMAYVAVSRGRYDAQIYTDDRGAIVHELGRDTSHKTALTQSPGIEAKIDGPAAQKAEGQAQQQGQAQAQGHAMGR